MAWYSRGDWDSFPPYVSVGEKKARGSLALAKLLKKSKRAAEPVVAPRTRQVSATFWGKAWCDNLERYANLANRLPRGRAYLRNGSVLDLLITAGRVEAFVAGSELYQVTIAIARPRGNASPTIGCPRCSGSSWKACRLGERTVRAAATAGAGALHPAPPREAARRPRAADDRRVGYLALQASRPFKFPGRCAT